MSSEGGVSDDDLDQEEDGAWEGEGPSPDEDGKVQRKLHLFKSASVQLSIKRLWDLLPRDDRGELGMEGYVELNLRLQKCLTKEFVLERAVDSAIGDWGEDVREGQDTMPAEEFAMFLFELGSLWCGPSVSLRVYLLFLNATFIAMTDARGAHTIGLKPLESIEHLPKAFFDLLSLQGWAKPPEEEARLDEDQALSAWFARNLTPDSEQAALLQVQRQVFQVTHDVRSVFLFRNQDGRKIEEADVLGLVKLASRDLAKVSKVDPKGANLPAAPALRQGGGPQPAASTDILCARPWNGHGQSQSRAIVARPTGGRFGTGKEAGEAALEAMALAQRRARSGPSRLGPGQQLARLDGSGSHPGPRESIPVGRTYETYLNPGRARGLMLAGQAAIDAATAASTAKTPSGGGSRPASATQATPPSRPNSRGDAMTVPRATSASSTACRLSPVTATTPEPQGVPTSPPSEAGLIPAATAHAATATVQAELAPPAPPVEVLRQSPEEVAYITNFLEAAMLLPPYNLPKNPIDLYKKQTDPLMRDKPGSIVFAANKWQEENQLVLPPFERVLKKLPENIRPGDRGPAAGPMSQPNEPIWFEMAHRLQVILKKQGKRAERKRKRKMRAKLVRGRGSQPPKRNEGRELREYFDRYAEERARGLQDAPGEPAGEFLGKVHERYLQRREGLEQNRFQVRGTGGNVVDVYGLGESGSPRTQQRVVRPVYLPPPGAHTEVM